jgi:outer membrane protein assembly factor BamA
MASKDKKDIKESAEKSSGLSLRSFLLVLLSFFVLLPGICIHADEGVKQLDTKCVPEGVRIEGNKFFDRQKLLSEIKLKPSSPYDLNLLEKSINKILTLYDENGFPYCQISPSRFKISDKGGLCFSFLVEEGPRVKVREIELEGLKNTKRKVILRELGSNPFGFFSQSRVDASLKRLTRLSYIKEVSKVELLAGENPEEGILRVTLLEQRNNTFSGILGYAPSAGDRRGNLFGSLELVFDNIFGTGRMTQWRWSRKDPHSSHLFFLYREPWVFGLPPTLELKLSQVDYDSTYLQLSFSARLTFSSTGRTSWGVEGGWEKVVPGPAGQAFIADSRKYSLGIICSFDFLNQPDNPRSGLLYAAELGYAQKRNYPTSDYKPEKEKTYQIRSSFDLNHFLPTLKKQTLHVGLHFRSLSTDEDLLPISDQFKLGGINSIRGYREEEFFGTQIAWANLEYRFLFQRLWSLSAECSVSPG